MKPYLDKIEVGKNELVNLFKSDDKLSIVVGIITLTLVLYLIFGSLLLITKLNGIFDVYSDYKEASNIFKK